MTDSYDPGAVLVAHLQEWLTLEDLQRTMRSRDRQWTPARVAIELQRLIAQGRVEGNWPEGTLLERYRRVDARPGELEPREEERRGPLSLAAQDNRVPAPAPAPTRGLEADLFLAVAEVFGDGWSLEIRRSFRTPGATVIVHRLEPRAGGDDIAGAYVQFVVGEEAEALEGDARLDCLMVIAKHAHNQIQIHREEQPTDG